MEFSDQKIQGIGFNEYQGQRAGGGRGRAMDGGGRRTTGAGVWTQG